MSRVITVIHYLLLLFTTATSNRIALGFFCSIAYNERSLINERSFYLAESSLNPYLTLHSYSLLIAKQKINNTLG